MSENLNFLQKYHNIIRNPFTKMIFEEYQTNIVKQNINTQKLTAHLFIALSHIKLDELYFNSKELKKHTKYLTTSLE